MVYFISVYYLFYDEYFNLNLYWPFTIQKSFELPTLFNCHEYGKYKLHF